MCSCFEVIYVYFNYDGTIFIYIMFLQPMRKGCFLINEFVFRLVCVLLDFFFFFSD